MDFPELNSSNLSDYCQTAKAVAEEAGRLLKERVDTDFKVSKKGRIDLVTEVDLAAEELIVNRLKSAYPDHQILAEERGEQPGPSSFKWIIDPLDGTTNYTHGYRFFGVSIALEFRGEVVAGVVHGPVTGETFSAIRGGGARLGDNPVEVSSEEELSEAMLCTGFSYRPAAVEENLRLFNALIPQTRAIRRDGSAALDLCYVACGRFDGFWELSLSAWDVAAGALIVEEAGGRVSRFDGSRGTIYDGEIVVSNGSLHESLLEALSAVRARS